MSKNVIQTRKAHQQREPDHVAHRLDGADTRAAGEPLREEEFAISAAVERRERHGC